MEDEAEKYDYILVVKTSETKHENERNLFENNLKEKGLILTNLNNNDDDSERFIGIKASKNILLQYAEIMKLRMPLKSNQLMNQLTEQFSRDKFYLFDVESENFITPSTKYMIINFILDNTSFDIEGDVLQNDHIGITKLILREAYVAAYPLHDEKRENLIKNWANIKLAFRQDQPLNEIKDYFGIKVALYFAWLNFYNKMLLFASCFGIIYTIFGLCTNNQFIVEVCYKSTNFTMCPQCDQGCDFWRLTDSCFNAKLMHILDNCMTIIFAIVISVWSAVYLNMWNNASKKIVHKWGIVNDNFLDHDLPTIQFLESKSIYTNIWKKLPSVLLSFTFILFWVAIVLAVLAGIIFYQIALISSDWLFCGSKTVHEKTVAFTASLINLVVILLLNEFYSHTAVWLTNHELHRTQKQFEKSLLWKQYIFWFINYYTAFFYIAFIKGRFVGSPVKYNRIFGYRQEECGPGGCGVELCIQLVVVMIGDLTYSNFMEYIIPFIQRKMNNKTKFGLKLRLHKKNKNDKKDENELCINKKADDIKNKQWISDYKLLYWGSKEISFEYLEMVLQYGLVVLFIIAFPLAPLIAYLNNIVEIRMDANKLITNYRRPVAQNVKNIGVWIPIMKMITKLAVITNGCMIAFATNFIPYFVYRWYHEENQLFIDFIFSKIKITDLEIPRNDTNITECRYSAFLNPPDHKDKYTRKELYWQILAARVIFVIIFQNVVSLIEIIINRVMQINSNKLKDEIVQEAKRTQQLIMSEDKKRALQMYSQLK